MTLVMLPIILADTYHKSELVIGLWYIPFGVGAMTASNIGGKVTDMFARKLKTKEGNWGGTMVGVLSAVIGFMLFGWVSGGLRDTSNFPLGVN
jgi:hypothetical protein